MGPVGPNWSNELTLSMISISWLLANAELLLGRILLSQRNFEQAEQHLNNAVALHEEQKYMQSVAQKAIFKIPSCRTRRLI